MFSFSTLITIAEEAVTEAPAVAAEVTSAITTAKSLLANPEVKAFETALSSVLHLTSAPSSAAVVTAKKA